MSRSKWPMRSSASALPARLGRLPRSTTPTSATCTTSDRTIWSWSMSKVLTLDILHDQIVRSDVVQVADVGVVERGNRPSLAGKALAELRIGHFDRDIAIQPGIMGAIHFAHPAFAD